MKQITRSENIERAIGKWKEKNSKLLKEEIKEKNFGRVFAEIYSFRSIVMLIDSEIEKVESKENWKSTKLVTPDGEIELDVKVKTTKYHKLIERWDKLEDVSINSTAAKELNMKFFDLMRLKFANYVGFIRGIIDFDYVIYETD